MPYKDPEQRKAYLREYHKRWYEENKESRQAQIRQYKRTNPVKVNEWRSKPESIARATEAMRKWRDANRERDRANRRVWSKQNRERVALYNMKYDRREKNARYYAANRDRLLQMQRLRYLREKLGLTAEQFELMAAFAGPK